MTFNAAQGLNALVYKTQKQPEFSLVSNGAEVIMIDKRFYEEHCSQRLMTDLREEVGEPGGEGALPSAADARPQPWVCRVCESAAV